MSRSRSNTIGVTMGDPGGIGPEIIAKALARPDIRKLGHFAVIGDLSAYRHYTSQRSFHYDFIDLENFSRTPQHRPNAAAGRASLKYLDHAIRLLKASKITSLVTAPVSKEAIVASGVKFSGHTEYLAHAFGVKKFGMMFVSDKLNAMVVTRHIPIQQVSRTLTIQNILETIELAHQGLKRQFGIKNPRIAVCGLNPHAGEAGSIGKEELIKIIPAIRRAQKKGIKVTGPFAADTLFRPQKAPKYDLVVAMYHDQGLIPVKTLAFSTLVNFTAGLPFIRTSPAHGTAFDIAGKNKADASSMIEAIRLAARLST